MFRLNCFGEHKNELWHLRVRFHFLHEFLRLFRLPSCSYAFSNVHDYSARCRLQWLRFSFQCLRLPFLYVCYRGLASWRARHSHPGSFYLAHVVILRYSKRSCPIDLKATWMPAALSFLYDFFNLCLFIFFANKIQTAFCILHIFTIDASIVDC